MNKQDLLTKQDLKILLKKAFQKAKEAKYDNRGFIIPTAINVPEFVLQELIEYLGEEND